MDTEGGAVLSLIPLAMSAILVVWGIVKAIRALWFSSRSPPRLVQTAGGARCGRLGTVIRLVEWAFLALSASWAVANWWWPVSQGPRQLMAFVAGIPAWAQLQIFSISLGPLVLAVGLLLLPWPPRRRQVSSPGQEAGTRTLSE